MEATANRAWAAAPRAPRLADGELHVWRVDLAAVGDAPARLLSSQERIRAQRLARERDRHLWSRARGVLRELLGRYLRSDPRALRFSTGEHGKPALACGAARIDLPSPDFNLAHSGELALYALSGGGPVGVDVERGRRRVDVVAVAERVFGDAEAARLRALDADARQREFLRAWVRHEAQLKCRGLGVFAAGETPASRPLWIAELDVGASAAAAVAAEDEPRALLCWEYPGA